VSRRKRLAAQQRRRREPEHRHEHRERRDHRGGVAPQERRPEDPAERRRDEGQVGDRADAAEVEPREGVADPARPLNGERQPQQRERRHEADPGHEAERVVRLGGAHADVSRAPAGGRAEHEEEAGDGRAVVEAARHEREAGEREQHAQGLNGPDPLAEERDGEGDREQRLSLHQHRGEAGRHPHVHPDEQQRELHEADRRSGGQDPAPGRRPRAAEDEQREGGEEVAQRREQERREVVEAHVDDHEVEPPDGGDEDGCGDVNGTHPHRCSRPPIESSSCDFFRVT
jgi:hypothetical protein